MHKVSKSEVDYSIGMKGSHCGQTFDDDKGYCRHFVEPRSMSTADLGTCEKVSGPISRVFWCRLFAKAQGR